MPGIVLEMRSDNSGKALGFLWNNAIGGITLADAGPVLLACDGEQYAGKQFCSQL
jgi:hypothetical protein